MSVRTLIARAFPFVIALTLLSTALFPHELNPSIVTVIGTFLGGLACFAAATFARRTFSRDAAILSSLLALAALWFALASTWAASPVVALFGIVGQHNGAALWILFATWILAGVICADARCLRETLAVVSVAGVIFASAGFWETLASGSQRGQGYAAGLFENSTSAGEMLGVALIAALTGSLIARTRPSRFAWIAGAVVCAGGLIQSSSRTGLLGLGAALTFAAAVQYVRARNARPWMFGLAATGTAFVVTASLLASSAGVLGIGAQRLVSELGTQRDVIWRAALAQIAQAPLVGQGLDQFSTLIDWGLAGGRLTFQATTDPHNVLVAAALGGGVVGALLLLGSFTALLAQGATVVRSAAHNPGVALTASFPAFILGAGLVGWISPAAALSAASIAGATLGAAGERASDVRATKKKGRESAGPWTQTVRTAGLAVGLGAIVLALLSLGPLSVGRAYVATQLPGGTPLSVEEAAQLYARYPDPRIPADVLDALTRDVQAGSREAAGQADRLLAVSERGTSWSSLLAVRQLVTAQALESKDAALFPNFERIVHAAAGGDPTTGAWYAFAALEAGRLGKKELSVDYARRALLLPMAPADRELLQRVASQ